MRHTRSGRPQLSIVLQECEHSRYQKSNSAATESYNKLVPLRKSMAEQSTGPDHYVGRWQARLSQYLPRQEVHQHQIYTQLHPRLSCRQHRAFMTSHPPMPLVLARTMTKAKSPTRNGKLTRRPQPKEQTSTSDLATYINPDPTCRIASCLGRADISCADIMTLQHTPTSPAGVLPSTTVREHPTTSSYQQSTTTNTASPSSWTCGLA
jgi:hypothetical protein